MTVVMGSAHSKRVQRRLYIRDAYARALSMLSGWYGFLPDPSLW